MQLLGCRKQALFICIAFCFLFFYPPNVAFSRGTGWRGLCSAQAVTDRTVGYNALFERLDHWSLRIPTSDFLAVEALLVVNTDHSTTLAAFVKSILPFQKRVYAVVSNHSEVSDRAVVIVSSVSFIEVAQMCAGELRALIAVMPLSVRNQTTLAFEVGTAFVPRSAS